jgi:hypothetical protein
MATRTDCRSLERPSRMANVAAISLILRRIAESA